MSQRARLTTALLGWFAVFLACWVHPALVYGARGPVFATTAEYAQQVLLSPGGLARYLGLLLAQGDALDWLGVLLHVGQAGLMALLSARLADRIAGRPLPWLGLLPVALYALASGHYDQPLNLGPLLIALLGAATVHAGLSSTRLRLPAGVALCVGVAALAAGGEGPVVLWLAGLGLALTMALTEATRGGALAAAMTLTAPTLLLWLGAGPLADTSWSAPSPVGIPSERVPWLALAALATPALLAAGAALAARWPHPPEPPRWMPAAALMVIMTVLAVTVSADRQGRYAARLESLIVREQWPEVLAFTAREGMRGSLPCHDVNRALLAAGRLADDMFTIRQRPTALMLPLRDTPTFSFRHRLARQYMALGRLRDAEHLLHDCLPLVGPNPWVLRDLALCAAALDEPAAARVYLHRLARDLVHGGWARRRLRDIDTCQQVAALRAGRLTTDDVADVTSTAARDSGMGTEVLYDSERMLLGVLRDHPRHRMAYEYLMGLYLLGGRLDRLAAELHRLDAVGYQRLPRAWEEGLLVHEAHSAAPLDLHGRAISAESRARYEQCRAVVAECGDDLSAAAARVAQVCPDSYFAYRLRQGDGL